MSDSGERNDSEPRSGPDWSHHLTIDGQSAFRGLIDEECSKLIAELDGEKVVHVVEVLYNYVTGLEDELLLCKHFQFLSPSHLQGIEGKNFRAEARLFWREVNLLLTYIVRAWARTSRTLIEGTIKSLASRNELLLSLTVRSFIEHTCSLVYLSGEVAKSHLRFERIWTEFLAGTLSSDCVPTPEERQLHATLFKFAVGSRVEFTPEQAPGPGDSISSWRQYNDSLKSVPGEMQAISVVKCIDRTIVRDGYRWVKTVYEIFCEYCHPNAASRSLDFSRYRSVAGKHFASDLSSGELSPSFRRIWDLTDSSIPAMCLLMHEGLCSLSSCRLTMPELDESAEEGLPPVGSVSQIDAHGRIAYYDPRTIGRNDYRLTQLTSSQVTRAATILRTFSEFFKASVDDWLNSFVAMVPANAEFELTVWEYMARVYSTELERRVCPKEEERRLLMVAIIRSREFVAVGELLSAVPLLKRLPDVDRVFHSVGEFFDDSVDSLL